MSARKVRLVADMIRGIDAHTAIARLRMLAKASAKPLEKIVASAVANAEHNFRLDPNALFIKTIFVNEGSALKRWRARAFGRAAPIRKHSCHITVILDERVEQGRKGRMKKDGKKAALTPNIISKAPVIEPADIEKKAPKNMPVSSVEHTQTSTDPRRLGKHRNKQNADRKEMHEKKGFVKTFFNRKSGS